MEKHVQKRNEGKPGLPGWLKKRLEIRNHLSQTQFIAYGFLGIILLGTLILMLPVSNRSHRWRWWPSAGS